jgi:hypothetical protein
MNVSFFIFLPVIIALVPPEKPRDLYAELDASLKAQSKLYAAMADAVRKRHAYRIEPTNVAPLGNVRNDEGEIVIELSDKIPENRQATILIWQMVTAYQREAFIEITRRAKSGEIDSHREFGLRMELVEYSSFQLHREVLEELSKSGIKISDDHLFFLNPKLNSLDEYRIPLVHAYIDAQSKSGHTRAYEEWYYRVTKKIRLK